MAASSLVGARERRTCAIPQGLRESLREHVRAAINEMGQQVREQVPEYAWVTGSTHEQNVQKVIDVTVTHFVDSVGDPDADHARLTELYAKVGAYEAREGHSLDNLQAAMRLVSQIACRRFIKDAYRLGWSRETLGLLTDSLFTLLAEAADAAAQGYAREQGRLATAVEHHRSRLRDLLISEPPASRQAISDLARLAEWSLPRSLAVVAVSPDGGAGSRIMPPSVLADWECAAPYLLVPDPDRPGQRRYLAALMQDRTAAVGPTVPVTDGAVSLRWARRAVELTARGIIPGGGVVHCVDELATLAASEASELINAASATGFAALRAVPSHRRRPLLDTLLAYLENGNNAAITARHLGIHEQTVRYRLRRVSEITDGRLPGEESKIDTMLMLTWMLRSDPASVPSTAAPAATASAEAVAPAAASTAVAATTAAMRPRRS